MLYIAQFDGSYVPTCIVQLFLSWTEKVYPLRQQRLMLLLLWCIMDCQAISCFLWILWNPDETDEIVPNTWTITNSINSSNSQIKSSDLTISFWVITEWHITLDYIVNSVNLIKWAYSRACGHWSALSRWTGKLKFHQNNTICPMEQKWRVPWSSVWTGFFATVLWTMLMQVT